MPRLPRPAPRLVLLALAAPAAVAPGCTRHAFRQRADNDVTGVITQKNVFPDWEVRNWHVYPDPRARFADPSDPDRPPYPPDDFAARILSPNPQHPDKKSGAGRYEGVGYLEYLSRWDAENRADGSDADAPPPPQADPAPKGYGPAPEKLPPPKTTDPKPPGPVGAAGPAPGGVLVAVGEVTNGTEVVPVAALIPVGQQPDQLPDVKGKDEANRPGKDGPGPFPAGPGTPPGGPAVPGETGPLAATGGDIATDFLKALVTNQTGFRIKLQQAVEFGLFNSREFQDRREDLYLAALPVTLERFNFAALGFFTEQAALDYAGRLAGRAPRESAAYNTGTGFSKLFPTGAALAVRLANRTVVDLADGRPTTTLSNLTLSLAQPFLRGGGYAVTLEPLTLTERNMLYAMRSYARFRKLYYVSVVAGGNITNNPYGLQGLAANLGRGIGGNLTAPVVGFLPLNLQAATIANQRRNVAALEGFLRQYQAFEEGGQQSGLQVSQVEQQLVSSRTQLLGQSFVGQAGGGGGGGGGGGIRGYLDTLDSFKLQLGLPLTVGLDLDQTPLKPIRDQLRRFDDLYAQAQEVADLARRYDPAMPVAEVRARGLRLLTESALVRGTQFAQDLPGRLAAFRGLADEALGRRLLDLAEERRKLLDRRADLQAKGLPEPEADTRRVNQIGSDLDLGSFERSLRGFEALPPPKDGAGAGLRAAAFRDVFNNFYQLVLEGRNERLAGIRRQWPKLPAALVNGVDLLEVPLDDATTTVVQTALTDRLDLMNARGQVVDAWRQIKVQANSLLGTFDVEYNLSSSTPPGGVNPLALGGGRTAHNLTFSGELPLVRRAERNNYRAALIGYQRQRRTLQAFEDNIANDVRADTREIRTINELYRFQQRLIEIAYFQVDNARELVVQPPAPGGQTDAGSAAALTNQLLQAQQSLITAQNSLYQIYVNYLVSRMTLYLDLEQMQIDERGEWSNEPGTGREDPDRPGPGPGPVGERLPGPRLFPRRAGR